MAKLLVFKANGGNIYNLLKKKKYEKKKEGKIIKLEEKLINKKLNQSIIETRVNIPYLSDGRKTWQGQRLRSLNKII